MMRYTATALIWGQVLLAPPSAVELGGMEEGFAVVRMCSFGAIAWFPVSQVYPETAMRVRRYARYDCREQHSWWLPAKIGDEFDYVARSQPKSGHAQAVAAARR